MNKARVEHTLVGTILKWRKKRGQKVRKKKTVHDGKLPAFRDIIKETAGSRTWLSTDSRPQV